MSIPACAICTGRLLLVPVSPNSRFASDVTTGEALVHANPVPTFQIPHSTQEPRSRIITSTVYVERCKATHPNAGRNHPRKPRNSVRGVVCQLTDSLLMHLKFHQTHRLPLLYNSSLVATGCSRSPPLRRTSAVAFRALRSFQQSHESPKRGKRSRLTTYDTRAR